MKEKQIFKISVAIIAFLIIVTVVSTIIKMHQLKEQIIKYDSYAQAIENYSFVLGWRNTVKCEMKKPNDYKREYIYNDFYDSSDKVIFHLSLFHNYFEFEQKGLFKNIHTVSPFPENALPSYMETQMEFRHYLSGTDAMCIFTSDNPHAKIALSLSKSIHYEELQELQNQLDKLGYAVKFCWVDTYLPEEITDSSKFAMGVSPQKTMTGYQEYNDYNRVYGFMLYDHDYADRTEFENPQQNFIEIISAPYEDDNFMTAELSEIYQKLLQKGELGSDSLEIIGIVLEKKDGTQFSKDEAETMFQSYDFIKHIIS